jgi:tetratricopeptide (TPR) repeat protein
MCGLGFRCRACNSRLSDPLAAFCGVCGNALEQLQWTDDPTETSGISEPQAPPPSKGVTEAALFDLAERDLHETLQGGVDMPSRIGSVIDRANRMLTPDIAATQGSWVLGDWSRSIGAQARTPRNRLKIELLCARVALLMHDYDRALENLSNVAALDMPSAARLLADELPAAGAFADVTSMTHLQVARLTRVVGQIDRALEHIELAMELGFGTDQDAEGSARQLKAQLLVSKGRMAEAGQAYFDLGLWRWARSETEIPAATEALRESLRLRPDHQVTYWYLADLLDTGTSPGPDRAATRRLLEEARDVWEVGYSFGSPDADNAWAYAVRASIAQQLASLCDDSPRPGYWDGAVFAERALALDDDASDAWGILGRCHRLLNNFAAALQVIEHANEFLASDAHPYVLWERAYILYLVGDPAAYQAIMRCRTSAVQDSASLDILEASLRLLSPRRADALRRALALAESAVARSDGEDLLARTLRGTVKRLLAQRLDGPRGLTKKEHATATDGESARLNAEALADFTWIWQATNEGVQKDDLSLRGWAAYQLAKYAEAIEIFQGLVDAPLEDPFDILVNLSYCCLAARRLSEAERWFSAGMRALRTRRNVRETLRDLSELHGRLQGESRWQAERKTIRRFRRIISSTGRELPPLDATAAERELRDALVVHEVDGVRSSVWVGAMGGLGRLYVTAERWREAADVYATILDRDEHGQAARFPEARGQLIKALQRVAVDKLASGDLDGFIAETLRIGEIEPTHALSGRIEIASARARAGQIAKAGLELDRAAELATDATQLQSIRRRRGDILLQANQLEQAESAYEQALVSAEAEQTADRELCGLQARLALMAAYRFDFALAKQRLARSLDLSAQAHGDALVDPMVTEYADLLLLPRQWRAVAATARLMASERGSMPRAAAARLALLRLELARRTAQSNRVWAVGETDPALSWVTTPLILDADDRLFPQGADTPGVVWLLGTALPALRQRIQGTTGVRPPGVRLRAKAELSNRFEVLVCEVPIFQGFVFADQMYSPDAGAAGLDRDGQLSPEGPAGGTWLSTEAEWTRARDAGFTLLDPFEYMVPYLERIILKNLPTFLGMQELASMLDLWVGGDAARKQLVDQVVGTYEEHVRLVSVLQTLLRDQISVANLLLILEAFIAACAETTDTAEVAERVRGAVWRSAPPQLPKRRIRLRSEIEAIIARCVRSVDGKRFLAAPPLEVSMVVSAIDDALGGIDPADAVLVVTRPGLRRFLRSLVERAFPSLTVVNKNEVGSTPKGRARGTATR